MYDRIRCWAAPVYACVALALVALSGPTNPKEPHSSPHEIVVVADRPGAPIAVEFTANASRLSALVGVADSADLRKKVADESYVEALRVSIRTRFPAADRVRIGNLFFGYSCAGMPLAEMANRGADGSISYEFGETLDMLELLVRTGTRPILALTGTPRVLIPEGEEPVSHPAYGCVNAPRLDLSRREPRDRAPEWWSFQTAFFSALRKRFGDRELAKWEFATWTEPTNRSRNSKSHLVLPKSLVDAGMHDEAVATIIAASIDAAMAAGMRIHIGNFAGNIAKEYPAVMSKIRAFPRGPEYLDYITGYAVSRYRTNLRQDIGRLMDEAIALQRHPGMPEKPLFLDELGQLVDDTGGRPPAGGAGLIEASFVAAAVQRLIESQKGPETTPRRVALWNTAILPRARDVVKDVHAFVPSATMNVVDFFEKMNGRKKLTVLSPLHDIVAGVDGNTISLVVLGQRRTNAKDVRPGPILKSIRVTGLEHNRTYVVTTKEVSQTQGNAVSVFLNAGSHLDEAQERFQKIGDVWRFATRRDEKCFFDEIPECSWRSKGRLAANPKRNIMHLETDQLGSLKMVLSLDPGGAIFATIALR